jgi:cysteine desulfurase
MLDDKGVAGATGSACSSKKLQASHVLLGIGLDPAEAHGSIRFSLSIYNTGDEVDFVIEKMPAIVNRLRELSPFVNSK